MIYVGEIIYINDKHKHGTILNLDEHLRLKTLEFKDLEFKSNKKLFKESQIVTFSVRETNRNKWIATDILAIEDEKNENIIEKCLHSQNPNIWLSVLKNAANFFSYKDLKDFILPKLDSVDSSSFKLGYYMPMQLKYEYPEIRKHFHKKYQLEICTNLLKSDKATELHKLNVLIPEIKELITDGSIALDQILSLIGNDYLIYFKGVVPIKDLFPYLIKNEDLEHRDLDIKFVKILESNNFDYSLLDTLPEKVIYEQLFDLLPIAKQITYTVRKLNKKDTITNSDLKHLISLLESVSVTNLKNYLDELEGRVKSNRLILKYLNTNDQLEIIYDYKNEKLGEVWSDLLFNTKILFIYSVAKRNIGFSIFNTIKEDNQVVKALLNILWAKDHESRKDAVFGLSHNMIQDYVVDFCWESTLPVSLGSLLPKCSNRVVMYCEGKKWGYEVFCPRLGRACPVDYSSRKIQPNKNLAYREWSIMELLDSSNIIPILNGLDKPEEYTNKVSGWVNRLNEIRERLKCTSCGKVLISNKKYSKNLAAYNTTVFSCNCGDQANNNVYISHCWGCREIIDSRDGNFRLEGYYLCLKCGSGNQNSEYKQGKYCPSCGSTNMKIINESDNRNYICYDCGHVIRIPPEHKWTGIVKNSNDFDNYFEYDEDEGYCSNLFK